MPEEGIRDLSLPPVQPHESLRERVTHALRAALVTGEMRPGTVYSAPMLAERFGVSATPVREAMLDLTREGLVETVRNKGFRPVGLTERDLDEIIEVRALLEGPAAARVAASAPRERIEALRPLAAAVVAAAGRGDVIAYVEADNEFHLGLIALTGNQRLVDTVRDLRYRSRLYGVPALAERGGLGPSAAEHHHILDVLLTGDPEAARQAVLHHLGHVRGIWSETAVKEPE
jgi:DNA-binding GntR family transcriptional regulator